jgi:hypothetical protein
MVSGVGTTGEDREEDINVAAAAAYRTSIDTGRPLSERKLAAMFGKTSRRWASCRVAEARHPLASTVSSIASAAQSSAPPSSTLLGSGQGGGEPVQG